MNEQQPGPDGSRLLCSGGTAGTEDELGGG